MHLSVYHSHRALLMSVILCALGYTACALDEEKTYQPVYNAQVSILNKTNELQTVSVTLLKENININCDAAKLHPGWYLRDLFNEETTKQTELFSGQEIPVHPDEWFNSNYYYDVNRLDPKPCHAVRMEISNAPTIVVLWDQSIPHKSFYRDVEVPKEIPSDVHTIELRADYSKVAAGVDINPWFNRPCSGIYAYQCTEQERKDASAIPAGATYSWSSSNTIRLFGPTDDRPEPTTECALSSQIQWSGDLSQGELEAIIRQNTTEQNNRFDCVELLTNTKYYQLCLPDELLALFNPPNATVWMRVLDQQSLNNRWFINFELQTVDINGEASTKKLQLNRVINNTNANIRTQTDSTCPPIITNRCALTMTKSRVSFNVNKSIYPVPPKTWTTTPLGDIFVSRAVKTIASQCGDPKSEIDYAIVSY